MHVKEESRGRVGGSVRARVSLAMREFAAVICMSFCWDMSEYLGEVRAGFSVSVCMLL